VPVTKHGDQTSGAKRPKLIHGYTLPIGPQMWLSTMGKKRMSSASTSVFYPCHNCTSTFYIIRSRSYLTDTGRIHTDSFLLPFLLAFHLLDWPLCFFVSPLQPKIVIKTSVFSMKKSRVAEILPHYVPFICWSGRSWKSSMCLLRRSIYSAIEATVTIALMQSMGGVRIFCVIVFVFCSLFSFKAI